jgi:hypothetical protein
MTARVRWLPGGGPVAGYDVFVRRAAEPYAAPHDAGLPPAGPGGVLSYDVAGLADGVTHYVTVMARASDGLRSPCVGELPLGETDSCLVERCCPGAACTAERAADGTPCDAHAPCGGCRDAACVPLAETPLETSRLRLAGRPTGTRLSAAGVFPADVALDPAADGVGVSLVDAAGTVLLNAFAPPGTLRPNAAGTTWLLPRALRDGPIAVLALRRRQGQARVRARVQADAVAGTPAGWAVTSGGGCARDRGLACVPTPRGLTCR